VTCFFIFIYEQRDEKSNHATSKFQIKKDLKISPQISNSEKVKVDANVQITAESNPVGETVQDVKTDILSVSQSLPDDRTMDQKDDQDEKGDWTVVGPRRRRNMAKKTRDVRDRIPTAPKRNTANVEISPLTPPAKDEASSNVPNMKVRNSAQTSKYLR